MNDLHAADVVFVATHSQGSIVSTHLLDRLIRDGHLRTVRSLATRSPTESVASGSANIVPTVKPQRICCLALCGIHLGPLRYLSTSSILQPYFQVINALELYARIAETFCVSILNLRLQGSSLSSRSVPS